MLPHSYPNYHKEYIQEAFPHVNLFGCDDQSKGKKDSNTIGKKRNNVEAMVR